LNLRLDLAFLDRTALSLQRVRGFKRLGISAGLGAAGALGFEPFRAFPLLLLSYAGLVLLLDGAAASPHRLRRGFGIGWAYGFGLFLVGLHWIGYAFLVDADAHAWELPFVAILMPGGLGLFFAAGACICMLRWRPGVPRIFQFALVFALIEWVRGHALTGFPWNLPAYTWGALLGVLQSTSVFGAYGLSLLTLLFGASLAALPKMKDVQARWLPAAITVFFIALWANGELRLFTATSETVPGVHLRIVQPDTPQTEKYLARYLLRNWQRLIDLSESRAAVAPTIIIWPEAAPPFQPLARFPEAMADIAKLTAESRLLMTGEVRVDGDGPRARYYNSFAMFGPHGKLLATSDKFHLVPFGEYLPFEDTLRSIGLTEIAANTGFSSGRGPETFSVPGAPPVGPLICYEVIFPQAVTGDPRPSWLVNMTDDSWFGPNAGPMQHLLIARVRAIEEGLPIVRAANSGISAVIDPYGRVPALLDLGLRGIIDHDLPVALPPTPFARYGNFIMLALFLICAGAALWPLTVSKA
jgi:apolipoprotein N-acyltransferase